MLILALESSAKAASVAVCEDGRPVAQYWQNSALTHSKTLLAMAEDMLKNIDMRVTDMDAIAVANGPGSFTGVRIGVAAAKGLAWAADKPIRAVSTLEAMAYHLADREDVIVCPAMDARRGQIYNALFEPAGGELKRICPDRAIAVSELMAESKKFEKPLIFVGDGAKMCYNKFLEEGVDAALAPEHLVFQSAWGVGRAAMNVQSVPPDDLEPNYLRLSQAERERQARLEKQ